MSLLELFLSMPLPAQIIAVIYAISVLGVLLIMFFVLPKAPVIEDDDKATSEEKRVQP